MTGKYWVCRECLVAHVNGIEEAGRESAIWDSAWDCGRYLESVAGLDLAYDVDPETEDGINTFSRSACELCDSRQAGERFRLALVDSSPVARWESDGASVSRVFPATLLVGYVDEPIDEIAGRSLLGLANEYGVLCLYCADSAYGAGVQELPPVRVGELMGSDTPCPSSWQCCECEAGLLTYL